MTRGEFERDFSLHKISFRPGRVYSVSHTARISPPSAPAVPIHRLLYSSRDAPRNAMGRRGTARNQFPKSFRSPRPPANRRLSLPHNARLRSPLEGPAAAQDLLRSTGDRDVSPTEYSGPRHLPARRAIRVGIVQAI